MNNTEGNKSFETVIKIINGSRMREKLKSDFSNISFKKTRFNNYAIFLDGICAGLFVDKSLISEKELKQIGWKVHGKME